MDPDLDVNKLIDVNWIIDQKLYFQESYTLCRCFLSFTDIRNAYMTILVNDIFMAANISTFTYVVTLSVYYALPSCVFFVLASVTYVH